MFSGKWVSPAHELEQWHFTANSVAELSGVTATKNLVMVGMGQLPTVGKEVMTGKPKLQLSQSYHFFSATT